MHNIRIEMPEKATTFKVIETLDKILRYIFSETNNVSVKIHKPYIDIISVNPIKESKIKLDAKEDKGKGLTVLHSNIKPENRHKLSEVCSYLMIECMMDNWHKYNITDCYCEINVKGDLIFEILFNKGFSSEDLKKVVNDNYEGYSLDGLFWERDWMRPEHKEFASGSGQWKQ